MRRGALSAALLGVALVACQSSVVPSPTPSAPATATPAATGTVLLPSPSVTTTSAPSPTTARPGACAEPESSPTLVAYADAGDLWLYDATTDRQRRLTNDGDARYEHAPAFVSGACLVYASTEPATIELLDLESGTSRPLVEETASIQALALSPDGTSLLYLQIDHDVDSTYRLKRSDLDGGGPEVLHTFAPNPGRGAGSEDEVSVAWSPDGTTVLVANTVTSSEAEPYGAIYLFDVAGREVDRWAGTHPRWSPDGGTIYYRGHAGMGDQIWRALDVASKASTKLAIRPGTNRLAVSPDGLHVAYDTSWFGDTPIGTSTPTAAPNTYVFQLATGTETPLQRGALGPLWISDTEVVVTNARERGENSLNSWESLGTVSRIPLGGDSTPIDMTSTLSEVSVHIGR